jgi:mannose-6-phosphate isomerase-like protein (cupin superfamily)
MTWQAAHLDELDRLPVEQGLEWRPIRRRFGIRAFGVNAYTAEKPGDWVVEEHTETTHGHEELYLVVRGRARFTLDGEDVDAPAGTIVFLPDPKVKRVAVAEEEGTTVLAVGGKPGEAFTPSGWEWSFVASTQQPDEAVATMQAGVEELGETGASLYQLAKFEAKAGRTEDARAHIAKALELEPAYRQYAEKDDDLEEVL